MFNWVKKMFGAGAKEQKWISKPKVEIKAANYKVEPKKKNEIKPVIVRPAFKNKKELTGMTKAKLEEVGRVYGIELDRRQTKDKLVTELWKAIKK